MPNRVFFGSKHLFWCLNRGVPSGDRALSAKRTGWRGVFSVEGAFFLKKDYRFSSPPGWIRRVIILYTFGFFYKANTLSFRRLTATILPYLPYKIHYTYRKDSVEPKSILQPTYVGPTVDNRGLGGWQSWAGEPAYVWRRQYTLSHTKGYRVLHKKK